MKSNRLSVVTFILTVSVTFFGCLPEDAETSSKPSAESVNDSASEMGTRSESTGTHGHPPADHADECTQEQAHCLPMQQGQTRTGLADEAAAADADGESVGQRPAVGSRDIGASNPECVEALDSFRSTCFFDVMFYRYGCFSTGNGCPERSYAGGMSVVRYPNGARVEHEYDQPVGLGNAPPSMEMRYFGADGRLCLTTSMAHGDDNELSVVFRAGNGSEFSMEVVEDQSEPNILCADGTEVELSQENWSLIKDCGDSPSASSGGVDLDESDPCADQEPQAPSHNVGQVCEADSDCFGESVGCCAVEDDAGEVEHVCMKEPACDALEAQSEGRPFHLGCESDDECSNHGALCCIVSRDDGSSAGVCLTEAVCDIAQRQ